MKILLTGGCKNGKSLFAQDIIHKLSSDKSKFYIATMKPCDNEDLARIKRHKDERDGYNFTTIEQPYNINEALLQCKGGSVLLDSTTALLANEMFLNDGSINQNAALKVADELILLCRGVENIAIVSDYIYSDAMLYDEITEQYRRSLSYIDRALAKECDVLCEVSFGNKIFHKGDSSIWF